jgi:hypothetical protein
VARRRAARARNAGQAVGLHRTVRGGARRSSRRIGGGPAAGRLEAFVRDPGLPDVAAPVAADAETVEIVVPRGAVARVLLLDDAGRLWTDQTQVVVRVEREGATPPLPFSFAGGLGLIAGLPVGATVRFLARPYGRPPAERVAWFEGDVDGAPAAADLGPSPEDVTLALEAPAAQVAGTIPGAERGLRVRLAAWRPEEDAPTYAVFTTCDERGRFSVALPPGVNTVLEARASGRPPMMWFAPRIVARETAELPVPQADAAPQRGFVLRADGAPAAGAIVVAASAGAGDDRRPSPCAVAKEDGSFALHGVPAGAPWRPQARLLDVDDGVTYVADADERVGLSAEPLRLVLGAGGTVVGEVSGLPRDLLGGAGGAAVSIVLRDARGATVGYGAPDLDGTFDVRAPAGRVDASIYVPGLARIDVADVDVPPGGSVADPRLNPLVVAGPFASVVVRAERADLPADADPRLVGAVVAARFPDGAARDPLVAVTESLGAVRLAYEAAADPVFDVVWTDPTRGDYALRPASVRGPGERRVQLRPGATAAFAWPGQDRAPAPPDDASVQIVVVRERAPDAVAAAAPRTLRAPWKKGDGPPTFGSVPDGDWVAKLEVVREGSREASLAQEVARFVVRPEDAAVTVPLDPVAVAAAFGGR